MIELESILDTPKEGLDQLVWTKKEDGTYTLTDFARTNIGFIVEYVKKTFKLQNVSVRIIGSITSNQYSEDSDIDLHFSFNGLTEDNSEEFNKVLRADFDENFKDIYTGKDKVGEHPIEVYFQANPYQDMMSIGCYDFIGDVWMVGPDLKPLDFDPYSEFYDEDMEYVRDVVKDIRVNMLDCYELATVIGNSQDEKFKTEQYESLKEKLKKSVDVFMAAKQCRKLYSSPTSVEDALEKRNSRKWKIADSAFKLLDKFGYIKILKKFSSIDEVIKEHPDTDIDSVAKSIITSVQNTININETIEENMSKMTSTFLIAALLAIPGILPKEAIAKNLSEVPKVAFKIDNPAVQTAIKTASTDEKLYGGYTATNVINMIARTLYVEGHSQGTEGRKAILSVIVNRAGNDKNNIAAVIREPSAFSCWNKMTKDDWKNFVYRVPSKGTMSISIRANRKIWDECVRLATEAFNGKFKSTIGNRNSYLNPVTANEEARNTWGKKMDLKIKDHKFGYLREHDPRYVTPGTMKLKEEIVSESVIVD